MKRKVLALAACLAAFAIPTVPAAADEAIPGTCYEITLGGLVVDKYSCECLIGLPWVDVDTAPPPNVTITFCHVSLPRI